MEVTDRPPTRFSVVLPSEIRDQIRDRARYLGTHESVVVKLALRRYLADSPAECPGPAGYGPPTRRRPD
jgi:hypothetical protein